MTSLPWGAEVWRRSRGAGHLDADVECPSRDQRSNAPEISLMTYCNDTTPGLRLVHIGAAIGVACIGGVAATVSSSRAQSV